VKNVHNDHDIVIALPMTHNPFFRD